MRGGVYNANIGSVCSKTVSERHLEATSLQVDVLSGKQISRCLLFLRIVMISPKGQFPFTMQIGDMNLLAAKTGHYGRW